MISINLIIEAFDKNWTLQRNAGYPVTPITGYENAKNPVGPRVEVNFYYGKDTQTGKGIPQSETFDTKLPRIMAALMCETQGIPRDDAMLVMNIEQEDVWQRSLKAAKKVLERAMTAKKKRGKYEHANDMPDEDLNLYRVYLKWHLCLNYINLYKPTEFFSEKSIVEW